MDEEIINPVEEITPEEQAKLDALNALTADILQSDVVNTVKKLMLALGTAPEPIGELTPFILRNSAGEYRLKVSDYLFPIDDAVLQIVVPQKNKQYLESIYGNKNRIIISKRANETMTRVDGVAMPNEKIEV